MSHKSLEQLNVTMHLNCRVCTPPHASNKASLDTSQINEIYGLGGEIALLSFDGAANKKFLAVKGFLMHLVRLEVSLSSPEIDALRRPCSLPKTHHGIMAPRNFGRAKNYN